MKVLQLKTVTKCLSVVVLPAFLLAAQVDAASAKTVKGASRIAKKLERCRAKIYKKRGRSYIKGKCVGAINSSFSGPYSGAKLVKRKGKYVVTTHMVGRSSSGFTLKIKARNRKNGKIYRGTISMR